MIFQQCFLVWILLLVKGTISSGFNVTECDEDPPVQINPKTCCDIPPLIASNANEKCGVDSIEASNPLSCKQQNCVFRHHKLLTRDGIDKKAFKHFVDKWADRNPKWRHAIDKAKERCLIGKIPINDDVCDSIKIVFCISGTLYEQCPVWNVKLRDCRKLKDYMEKCYYNAEKK